MALGAIGNNGVLMQPLLVKEIDSPGGDVVEEFKPRPVRRVLSQQTAATMLSIMETVTQPGGTANGASPPGFTTAGKTGTAQKIVGRAYSHNKYNSVFMGLIPAQKPVLAITVIIEESKGAIFGGVVAAPVFKEIAGQALRIMGVSPRTRQDRHHPHQKQTGRPVSRRLSGPRSRAGACCRGWPPRSPEIGRGAGSTLRPFAGHAGPQGHDHPPGRENFKRGGLKCRVQGSGLAVSQDPSPGRPPLKPDTDCVIKFEPHS